MCLIFMILPIELFWVKFFIVSILANLFSNIAVCRLDEVDLSILTIWYGILALSLPPSPPLDIPTPSLSTSEKQKR